MGLRARLSPGVDALFTQIDFVTLSRLLVFAHAPDLLAWIGIGVIAASGVGNTLLSMMEVSRQSRFSDAPVDEERPGRLQSG